jgi:enoyl-CoA hydratase
VSEGAAPLLVEDVAPGVRRLVLHRPGKLNALDPTLVLALHDALDALDRDGDTHVVILTGSGRAFCAGADLDGATFPVGFEGSRERHWTEVQRRYSGIVLKLRRIPQVVIAAVNGPCAGGGFSMAMAADIRVAAREAFFIAAQSNIGQAVSEMGASYLLPRIVGGRAAEILLTGRRVQSDEAERIGLVSEVCDGAALASRAEEIARLLAAKSPLALRLSKQALDLSLAAGSLESAVVAEDHIQVTCVIGEDMVEGIQAFHDKRPPQYRRESRA